MWVFSTTLLQLHTEDRFRGRVFSADLGLLNADHRSRCLPLWTIARYRSGGSHARHLDGIGHADSGSAVGVRNAGAKGNLKCSAALKIDAGIRYAPRIRSILAAMMKSLSVRPSIL